MKIAIGNDHGGVDLKKEIIDYLKDQDHEIINVGTDTNDSCDYPNIAVKVANLIKAKKVDRGILICGTGIGMSISANKIEGIRAACCSEPYSAKLSREHNNANILCFGARVVGSELAKMIVDEYLKAEFLGDRHERRVALISDIEQGKLC